MTMMSTELRSQIAAGDAEFQRLAEEHSRYERQLEQISQSPYMDAADTLLEVKLKKLKLSVKDQMERRIAMLSRSVHTH